MTGEIRAPNVRLPASGAASRILANGVPVTLVRRGGRGHAMAARRSRHGGPLDEGTAEGLDVVGPGHGPVCSLENGRVMRGPATRSVGAFLARVEGTTVVPQPV